MEEQVLNQVQDDGYKKTRLLAQPGFSFRGRAGDLPVVPQLALK